MTVIENLKKSFSSSFSFYERGTKKMFIHNLAMVALIAVVACITTILCSIAAMIYDGSLHAPFESYFKIFFRPMAKSAIIYHLGIYGLYMLRQGKMATYGIEDFLKNFLKKELKPYLVWLAVLTALEIVTYKFSSPYMILTFMGGIGEFNKFVTLLVNIIKMLLPYAFAGIFIINVINKKVSLDTISSYKNSWWTLLISVIFIEGILNYLYMFLLGVGLLFNDGQTFIEGVLVAALLSIIYSGASVLVASAFENKSITSTTNTTI